MGCTSVSDLSSKGRSYLLWRTLKIFLHHFFTKIHFLGNLSLETGWRWCFLWQAVTHEMVYQFICRSQLHHKFIEKMMWMDVNYIVFFIRITQLRLDPGWFLFSDSNLANLGLILLEIMCLKYFSCLLLSFALGNQIKMYHLHPFFKSFTPKKLVILV